MAWNEAYGWPYFWWPIIPFQLIQIQPGEVTGVAGDKVLYDGDIIIMTRMSMSARYWLEADVFYSSMAWYINIKVKLYNI